MANSRSVVMCAAATTLSPATGLLPARTRCHDSAAAFLHGEDLHASDGALAGRPAIALRSGWIALGWPCGSGMIEPRPVIGGEAAGGILRRRTEVGWQPRPAGVLEGEVDVQDGAGPSRTVQLEVAAEGLGAIFEPEQAGPVGHGRSAALGQIDTMRRLGRKLDIDVDRRYV